MNDLSEKIIETIERQHIKHKPKWQFLLKDYFVWLFFSLSVAIGALATSVIIFIIRHQYYVVGIPNICLTKKMFIALPYFWILLLILFLIIAFYNFRHTKTGYRYSIYLILLLSIFLSLILGIMIYTVGVGEKLEDAFYQHIPVYRRIVEERGGLLISDDMGILTGVIIAQEDFDNFVLRDFSGKNWQVIYVGEERCCNEFNFPKRVMLLGDIVLPDVFEAEFIRPFFNRGGLPQDFMKERMMHSRINR